MEIPLELSQTQYKFLTSKARFAAMIAGVGAGKTFSLCLRAVMTAMENPGSHGTIVASTYRNLGDFVIPMLTGELWEKMNAPDGWDELTTSFNKQSLIANFKNGSKIYLRSCDRPDDLRGPNLGWFAIDEAAKVSGKVWRLMVARLRKPPEKGWITTTPRGRNWVWEEFAKRKRRDYEFFTGATEENKALTRDYIKSLKESYSGSFLNQEFYGQFVAWEGLVYPQVAVDLHHLDAPEDGITSEYRYGVAGTDWGWADPSVILTGIVGTDGLIHLVDEYYVKKKPIEDIAEAAYEYHKKWGIRTFHCDPSRPEYLMEFRQQGLDARKGKNAIDPGVAAVHKQIDRGLFRMDFNRCPETVRELETYHYEEDDTGQVLRDRPVDRDNHCMDALRYLVYGQSKAGHASSRRGFR